MSAQPADALPRNPQPRMRRRRLLVLHHDDVNRARSVAPELLADQFTTVVGVPLRPSALEDPELAALADELQPGSLLIRNRWEADAFVDSAIAYERISVAKFAVFADICQLLGASRLEVREIREVRTDGRTAGKIEFRGGSVVAGGDAGSEWLSRLAQSIQGSWVWAGEGRDADAAAEYAQLTGIHSDPTVRNLIQQRRFAANALNQFTLDLDISSEAQREVKAALQVQAGLRKLGLSLEAGLDAQQTEYQRLALRVEVTFRIDTSAP